MPLKSVAPTQRWQLDCPDCKAEKVHDVTYLLAQVVKQGAAGYNMSCGWSCEKCSTTRGFKLFWQGGQLYVEWGAVNPERSGPDRTWILLRLRGKLKTRQSEDEDIYFLLDFKGIQTANLSRYWFEEHTCPTNFIRGVDTIFCVDPKKDRIDDDPHGLFEVIGWLPHDGQYYGSSPNPHTQMWEEIVERIRRGEPHGLNPMRWSQADEHSPYDDDAPQHPEETT